jgi:hypothetical protein
MLIGIEIRQPITIINPPSIRYTKNTFLMLNPTVKNIPACELLASRSRRNKKAVSQSAERTRIKLRDIKSIE